MESEVGGLRNCARLAKEFWAQLVGSQWSENLLTKMQISNNMVGGRARKMSAPHGSWYEWASEDSKNE